MANFFYSFGGTYGPTFRQFDGIFAGIVVLSCSENPEKGWNGYIFIRQIGDMKICSRLKDNDKVKH